MNPTQNTPTNETQKEKILRYMQLHSDRHFRAIDFMQHGNNNFVGYEAPTRIGDLCRIGFVQRVMRDGKLIKDGRYALYQITEKGRTAEYIPPTPRTYRGDNLSA